MMKKILFLSAVAIIFAACQSKTEYTINGEVTDSSFEGQQITLVENVDNDMVTVDSTIVTNGKFTFKGETESPALRFITLDNARTIVMLEPGKINVKYDTDFQVSGTPINDAFNELNSKQNELNEEMMSISNEYRNAEADGTLTEEKTEELVAQINAARENGKTLLFDFIKANINNELGEYMFMTSSGMFEVEEQKKILDMASEEYKASDNVQRIIARIETVEKVAIGRDFVDITMENPEGETISLSDYAGKGKYVFIDFWAAWCGPCINEMPNVVEAYKKYKDKGLEIVGVSLDQDKEKWIEGIKELEMTWPQMSDLKLWESEAVELYGFRGIPHTVLLDKEGKIIAKDLRGEALHEKLAELLD